MAARSRLGPHRVGSAAGAPSPTAAETAIAPPAGNARNDTMQLGPLQVAVRTCDDALAEILDAVAAGRGMKIGFANTNLVYHALRDTAYAQALQDFVLLNDGVGLNIAAQIACGRRFPENLNGTDFTPRLLAACPAGTRVFLLGARADIVEEAKQRFARRFPALVFVGARDGFSCHKDQRAAAEADIAASAAQIVLVAMGNPLQEQWIAESPAGAGDPIWIGVGALFDFTAVAVKRAPAGVQKLKLEWLYRLSQEPKRLWRRYTVEAGSVAVAAVGWRLARRSNGAPANR